MMNASLTAAQLLDREFLEIRCRLLDVAAALDRIDRGRDNKAIADDARLDALTQALRVLTDGSPDRAARVQMVFSDEYDPAWRLA